MREKKVASLSRTGGERYRRRRTRGPARSEACELRRLKAFLGDRPSLLLGAFAGAPLGAGHPVFGKGLDLQPRADWLGLGAGRRWNQHRNVERTTIPRSGKNPLAVKLASLHSSTVQPVRPRRTMKSPPPRPRDRADWPWRGSCRRQRVSPAGEKCSRLSAVWWSVSERSTNRRFFSLSRTVPDSL